MGPFFYGEDMSKDLEAFNSGEYLQYRCANEGETIQRDAWMAACEYKNKQIDDYQKIIRETIPKITKENLGLQERTILKIENKALLLTMDQQSKVIGEARILIDDLAGGETPVRAANEWLKNNPKEN